MRTSFITLLKCRTPIRTAAIRNKTLIFEAKIRNRDPQIDEKIRNGAPEIEEKIKKNLADEKAPLPPLWNLKLNLPQMLQYATPGRLQH